MTCVSLIGMPGAGKSTLGVLLAKTLGYDFVDTDLLIQIKAQRTLPEIIANQGFMAMRALEAEIIASLDRTHTVIATGGSAVYSENSMRHLQQLGTIVYLRSATDTLRQRIGNLQQRGVAVAATETLESIAAERTPLYERYGNVCVDTDQGSAITVAKLNEVLSPHLEPIPH